MNLEQAMCPIKKVLLFILLALELYPGVAMADKGDNFDMKIHVKGTVVATGKCSFVQDDAVDVKFGDVQYDTDIKNTLKGIYTQPLVSNMTCSGDIGGKTQMKLDNSSGKYISDGSNKLLPVTYSGGKASKSLGIRLTADGAIKNAGEWFDVDMTNPPKLEAELVQVGDGEDFSNGITFFANATLTMAFN